MAELTITERRRLADLDGLVSAREGERLAALAATVTEGVIVEVGSHRGKSTSYLAAGSRRGNGARVFAIDLWEAHPRDHWNKPEHRTAFDEQTAPWADLITAIQGDSREVVKTWAEPIGLLFIDAGHEYENAAHDLREWSRFVIPGGALAVDDVGKPAVQRAIADECGDFDGWTTIGKLSMAVRRG